MSPENWNDPSSVVINPNELIMICDVWTEDLAARERIEEQLIIENTANSDLRDTIDYDCVY